MMSNALVVSRDLDSARRDLGEAAHALGQVWTADDHDAIGHLINASEALMRTIASVVQAVERLAELPMCDGGHAE